MRDQVYDGCVEGTVVSPKIVTVFSAKSDLWLMRALGLKSVEGKEGYIYGLKTGQQI